MVAFVASLLVSGLLLAIVFLVAKRRPPGTPVTWGEGYAAGGFVFLLFLMAYGIVPDRWLQLCDKDLKWRPDKVGIPLGPLWHLTGRHTWLHKGLHIPFTGGHWYGTRGRVLINAQHIRDFGVVVIYGIGLGLQCTLWSWWQKRGRRVREAEQAAVTATSAYGRPLTKPSQA